MKITHLILGICALLPAACTLHEEPVRTPDGEMGVDPTQVVVNADITLNIELPSADQEIFALPDTVMHRFIVEAFNADREVVNRQVIYESDLTATTFTIPVSMRLHAADYRLVVWSDYVRVSNPDAQLYYNAESLVPVINNGGYRGNTNAKDAFSAVADLSLRGYANDWNAKVNVELALKRPLGRYQIVSTDVEAFRRRVAYGTINGRSFSARIKYAGYLSVGYNCYDQVRKHSLNYMTYTTRLNLKDGDTSATLGFDYIFIAPDEDLTVPVEIEIVNDNNESVSRSLVNLPLQRDMNVTVSGRFLTSTADGGLVIDPGYDGSTTVDVGTLTPTR